MKEWFAWLLRGHRDSEYVANLVGQAVSSSRASAETIRALEQRIAALEASGSLVTTLQRDMDTLRSGIREVQDLRREMVQRAPVTTRNGAQFRRLVEEVEP